MLQPTWVVHLFLTVLYPSSYDFGALRHPVAFKSPQTGLLNTTIHVTMGLPDLGPKNTFGMWWNRGFAFFICSQLICNNRYHFHINNISYYYYYWKEYDFKLLKWAVASSPGKRAEAHFNSPFYSIYMGPQYGNFHLQSKIDGQWNSQNLTICVTFL